MLGEQRENLIAQLQKSFDEELPTVASEEGKSFFDTNTSTLKCVGKTSAQKEEVMDAIGYFKAAAVKLMENPNPENTKKAKYCDLAVSALTDFIK